MLTPDDIPYEIEAEIRAVNGGHWPRGKPEYERAARRFGANVVYFPRSRGTSMACFDRVEGTIFVPELRPRETPGRWHRHELAEACAVWEGREPFVQPARPPMRTRHEYARCVDLLEPRRPYLTQALDRQISHVAGILVDLLKQSGHQTAYITIDPYGRPEILLSYKNVYSKK